MHDRVSAAHAGLAMVGSSAVLGFAICGGFFTLASPPFRTRLPAQLFSSFSMASGLVLAISAVTLLVFTR